MSSLSQILFGTIWLMLFVTFPNRIDAYSLKYNSSSTPLPPSEDPWYTAPPNFETSAPGTILRLRVAPGNISTVANASATYNILYRTTDSNYRPSWAVTTLYIPYRSNSSTANSTATSSYLLSYQYPYDSVNIDDSPSYAFDTDMPEEMNSALARGWYVSVPDYEGPLASFTLGVQSGQATLDSLRAVLSSGLGLDSSSTKYVLWGYSGGALASEWAAELQRGYAPELEISGVALGGLTPNVSSSIQSVNSELYAALIPQGLLGMTTQYPEAREYLLSQLRPEPYNSTFLSVENITTDEATVVFANQDIYDYFINGMSSIYAPIMQELYDTQGLMGYHGVPQMPLYIYVAIGDEISNISNTDQLVNEYCNAGANILYERNTVGGHLAELTNGLDSAVAWLSAVLDGSYNNEGCVIRNVTLNTTSSSI